MQPKDVLIRQLNVVRTYVGAKIAQVVDTPLSDVLDLLVSQEIAEHPTPTDSDVRHIILTGQEPSIIDSELSIYQYDQQTLLIKLTEGFESPKQNTLEASELSEEFPNKVIVPRKVLNQVEPTLKYCWLRLSFEQPLPKWLIVDKVIYSSSVNGAEMKHFLDLLESVRLLLGLVRDYTALTADPLTFLCSRTLLQNKIVSLSKTDSVGLIMLHCVDFHQINKKFGYEYGDNVIQEIANNLRKIVRTDDIISRFSGALFGIAFSAHEQNILTNLAQKIQDSLQQQQYLDNAINLSFNVGAALVKHDEIFETESERASELLNRADHALTAAQQEPVPSVIVWSNDQFNLYQQNFNYLGGIFTADTLTDYRNMLLLWDISSLIADKLDFSELLQSVIQRLAQTFEFASAGIVSSKLLTNKNLLFSIDAEDCAKPISSIDEELLPIVYEMQATLEQHHRFLERSVNENLVLVLPLKIESPDCFFITGPINKFHVINNTKLLLLGLIRQLGKALRRSRLEEELNRKLESQNEQLQNELAQLKEGLKTSSLVYQSVTMQDLMKHTQRAAMTDTTVLVTGESGTGKERLIHAIHQLGARSDKPFVIVDCGSIPETLIESELFGHVKGAFTGAQNSSNGKIKDADGGVLVLDEIGELPLVMQSKLLRFVQEKQFTPLGSTKVISVDIKIVAVTNRDLAFEVKKGTFRKDLYYRLNVLTLHNPPLRARIEDIPLLSKHFLAKFSEQFNLSKKTIPENVLQKMQQYSWPGNIRELENRLMQASLQCEGNSIEWGLLNIKEETKTSDLNETRIEFVPPANEHSSNEATLLAKSARSTQFFHIENASTQRKESPEIEFFDDPNRFLEHVEKVITDQLPLIIQQPKFYNSPIGIWIEDELIIQTYIATGNRMRLTAARLDISQSTARRRVDKIVHEQNTPISARPDNWQYIIQALMPLANGDIILNDCLNRIKMLTLNSILNLSSYSMAQAAEIMGVSEPTFYKLKKELRAI